MKKLITATLTGTVLVGLGGVGAAQAAELPAQTNAEQRTALAKKFGVKKMPVGPKKVVKYTLRKKHVRGLVRSKAWAKKKQPRYVRSRESGGKYTINTGNGYYGAWQFDRRSWLANGGGKFSRYAHKSPKWAQDYVAWAYWKRAGWRPWSVV
jgi:hypothetical protein